MHNSLICYIYGRLPGKHSLSKDGSHTGQNLSSVLLETLVNLEIQDRVFGLTTDNASNNKTLVDSLDQVLSSDVTIIRTPCLAHVIRHSLPPVLQGPSPWLSQPLGRICDEGSIKVVKI